jgi:serine/threonine-protein kinase
VSGYCSTCRSKGLNETPDRTPDGAGGGSTEPPARFVGDGSTASLPTSFDASTLDQGEGTEPRVGRGVVPPPAFARYVAHERIGHGGMGEVFRATQRGTDRVVAVKLLHPGNEAEERQRKRFELEAQALGRLEHSGIVRVFEVGEESGRPYYSMEYVPGGTVAGRIRHGPPLDATAGAGIVATVARAVDAAHRAGVLHRDIKPSNILLGPDGSPKVSDFGLALFMDRADRMTRTGALLGTPPYMPPEQAFGEKGLGPTADVYGLGATLYEILTGKPPYEGSLPEVVRKVDRDPVVPPRKLVPELHPDLEAVCLKCLEKNPRDRYPSAAALADDLDRWGRGEGTTVRPAGPARKTLRWAARHKVWVAAAVTVLFAGLAAYYFLVVLDAKNESDRKLVRKETTTVVPATGKPVWWEWKFGDTELGESIVKDGTSGFQTGGPSMLAVYDDPKSDTFTLTMELRHCSSFDNSLSFVGFFLGYEEFDAEGTKASRALVIRFSDFWAAAEVNVPAIKKNHHLAALQLVTLFRPEGVKPSSMSFAASRFAPMDKAWAHNDWRYISADADPAGVRVRFGTSAADARQVFDISAEEFDRMIAKQNVAYETAGTGVVVPPLVWKPRAPLGVFADSAAVAFRNVTITPR